MKIFLTRQLKEIDRFTIENEPIHSIDLMERASAKMTEWIISRFERSHRFMVFAGPGNNGGDGLAIARMLAGAGYNTEVFFIKLSEKVSHDCNSNLNRLLKEKIAPVHDIKSGTDFPVFQDSDIVIDAIFGSGLAKPLKGLAAETVDLLNSTGCPIISVDIPSGLFGESNLDSTPSHIVKATHTLTLQFPKLSMQLPENYLFTGEVHILPIGLHQQAIMATDTPYYYMEAKDVYPFLKTRGKFDHKGNFGHGLLIAGSLGKAGAAILAAKAALRSGIGLVTCHLPSDCASVLQGSLPEAMVQPDINHQVISHVEDNPHFDAIGIGPGIGTTEITQSALHDFLKENTKPVVIDADGLNILSLNKEWYTLLKPGTILTPHLKEFERLAGKYETGHERISKQSEFSKKYGCVVVLKGAHTSVSIPSGNIYFNSTGNPGMATGGSGDVLTGIILSLLAQGYPPENAALTGVFIHGLAGDIAAEIRGFEALMASDITENLGNAFNRIRNNTVM